MSFSAAAWLVIVFAVIAANLPFVNERLFIVGPRRHPKSLGWRLLELVVLYGATLGVGFAIEARLGQIQKQGWEFYAALASLFLTLAFPGFIWRYLRRGS
ncbi:MAG: DUF2818 family protein [Pseudomonadota bacterium]|nr:DUF2818 family protein [Pseudomonadota bacterium]